jgi:hypothetical protein
VTERRNFSFPLIFLMDYGEPVKSGVFLYIGLASKLDWTIID